MILVFFVLFGGHAYLTALMLGKVCFSESSRWPLSLMTVVVVQNWDWQKRPEDLPRHLPFCAFHHGQQHLQSDAKLAVLKHT